MGEDVARPGLEGRHGVLRQGEPGRLAGVARLPPRRLRLHDVHRQLRAAARGGLQRRPGRGPGRGLGALRQPQLRGPDQPRREDELPRVAAAGGGVRAGGDDGHRPARRAARPGLGRRGRLPQGHLAQRGGRRAAGRGVRARGHVQELLRRGVRGRRALEAALEIPEGDRFAWSDDSTYVRRPTFLENVPKEPSDPGDIEGARVLAELGDSVTTDHISPAGSIKEDSPAGATSRSTASRRRTSTPTARGAATTR